MLSILCVVFYAVLTVSSGHVGVENWLHVT